MASNVKRRADYGKYEAPENHTVKMAKDIEVGDITVTPSGIQSTVVDIKLQYSKVELNEALRARYAITTACQRRGMITKIYTPSASVSVLKS